MTAERDSRSKAFEEALVDTMRHPVLVLLDDLHVKWANKAFCELFQIRPEEAADKHICELGNGQWGIPELKKLLRETLPRQEVVRDCRVEHEFESLGRRSMVINARRLNRVIVLAIEDTTSPQKDLLEQEEVNRELEQRVSERTAEAELRAKQLRALTAELSVSRQKERRRLAHILHDELQQLLVASQMVISHAKKLSDLEQIRGKLAKADGYIQKAVTESRTLAAELSPPVLQKRGLIPALHWLGEQMHGHHDLAVTVKNELKTSPELSQDLRDFLFQSVRELLFNVVKHAGVHEAWVRVFLRKNGDLVLAVEDMGKGCDPDKLERITTSGFGLFNIRERLESIGGSLRGAAGAEGKGCCVEMTVPLDD